MIPILHHALMNAPEQDWENPPNDCKKNDSKLKLKTTITQERH
jgi:hypothetical protein